MAASSIRYVSDWQALFEHRMTNLQDMDDLYERIWDRSKTPALGGMIANMRGEVALDGEECAGNTANLGVSSTNTMMNLMKSSHVTFNAERG